MISLLVWRSIKKNIHHIFWLFLVLNHLCCFQIQAQGSQPAAKPAVQVLEATIVDGYANRISYNIGDTCFLYLNSPSEQLSVFKLYDLNGRVVHTKTTKSTKQNFAAVRPFSSGFGYKLTYRFIIPELPSGIYLVGNKVPIIVKADSAEITLVYPSNTLLAYNNAGGRSFYTSGNPAGVKADTLSYFRPMKFGDAYASPDFFKWISNQNLDIRYIEDRDLDNYSEIEGSSLLLIVGHSEYWTRKARSNFNHFVKSGGNALILSGNSMWWQVQYTEDQNQVICFKDFNRDTTVADTLRTVNWNVKKLRMPLLNHIGCDFNYGGYGLKQDIGWDGFKILAPESPVFMNSGLNQNDILYLKSQEADGIPAEFVSIDSLILDSLKLSYSTDNAISDSNDLWFDRFEILAYDYCSRGGVNNRFSAILELKHSENTGTIINGASTGWCANHSKLPENDTLIKGTILRMINYLLTVE